MTEPTEANGGIKNKAQAALIGALNWLYDQVSGSREIADTARTLRSDAEIDRRIAYYCTMAGTAGFVTNVGGALTLPITLPANLLSVAALQLRLIGEVASARGYDLQGPEVRTFALACLTGNAALDILKEAGVRLGVSVGQRAIGQIAGATIARINQAVGFQLLTKAGTQGVVNLTKFVPVVGGLVGGTVDALSTKAVGEIAKRVFEALPTQEPGRALDGRNDPYPPRLLTSTET